MLKREHLKRKLVKYAKIKEQSTTMSHMSPKYGAILEAVERVETLLRIPYSALKTGDLEILCYCVRMILRIEAPEGMEWKLVGKKSCENCARYPWSIGCTECKELSRWMNRSPKV